MPTIRTVLTGLIETADSYADQYGRAAAAAPNKVAFERADAAQEAAVALRNEIRHVLDQTPADPPAAPDEDDDEALTCEICTAATPPDTFARTADGSWICQACVDRHAAAAARCDHRWEPEHDENGEPGRYCTRCASFTLDLPATEAGARR